MDDLDKRLVSILRADGRAPLSKLAQILGCSRGTVQNRLDRLMSDGTIAGFTIRLRDDGDGNRVRAVSKLEVSGSNTGRVIAALRRMPAVVGLHTTNGAWDLVADIEVANLAEFDKLLQAIRETEGIARSDTSLLLATVR